MADLTTIGVKFGWAVETVAGTKPTSFTQITKCKAIDGITLDTDTIDVTPLESPTSEYAKGLQDTGGTWNITFALSDAFVTAWEALISAYETAKASGLATWAVVYIPNMTNSYFITFEPGEIPMSAIAVSSPLEVQTSNTINIYKGLLTAVEPT